MKRIFGLLAFLALVGLLVVGGFVVSAQDQQTSSPVTKEAMQKHLKDLEKARDQTLANLAAINGAIQECQYWLDEIKRVETGEKGSPEKSAKDSPGP